MTIEHYISDDIDFSADMDDGTRSCMTAAVDSFTRDSMIFQLTSSCE